MKKLLTLALTLTLAFAAAIVVGVTTTSTTVLAKPGEFVFVQVQKDGQWVDTDIVVEPKTGKPAEYGMKITRNTPTTPIHILNSEEPVATVNSQAGQGNEREFVVTLLEYVEEGVQLQWHTSANHAFATLFEEGVYRLPFLVDANNGKLNAINQLYIVNGTGSHIDKTELKSYAIVSLGNDEYAANETVWNFADGWNTQWKDVAGKTYAGEDMFNNVDAEIIWLNQSDEDSLMYGALGQVAKFEFTYNIEGVVTHATEFNIAVDNGFVMFINGNLVRWSYQFEEEFDFVLDNNIGDVLMNLEDLMVLYVQKDWGIGWHEPYAIDAVTFASYFTTGENTVTIIAFNSPSTGDHEPAAGNPGAVLFGGTVYSQVN